ncbi:hypothetical protein L228DRAFT_78683 [Xylona heveae TC161]|uniref:Uncharacterized protein n=1 Tax=Xylona heveae (strain CBS 132557 / TC161) TaxID=1328760 RepID=A0A165IYI7_XYLHT|nr:hypothetical protein L228DRAFT_78683 [Xylona heveae TC161]KZF25553.1 hypothetical protein L228DRAFT_78683 [Xylona heveae TC161]
MPRLTRAALRAQNDPSLESATDELPELAQQQQSSAFEISSESENVSTIPVDGADEEEVSSGSADARAPLGEAHGNDNTVNATEESHHAPDRASISGQSDTIETNDTSKEKPARAKKNKKVKKSRKNKTGSAKEGTDGEAAQDGLSTRDSQASQDTAPGEEEQETQDAQAALEVDNEDDSQVTTPTVPETSVQGSAQTKEIVEEHKSEDGAQDDETKLHGKVPEKTDEDRQDHEETEIQHTGGESHLQNDAIEDKEPVKNDVPLPNNDSQNDSKEIIDKLDQMNISTEDDQTTPPNDILLKGELPQANHAAETTTNHIVPESKGKQRSEVVPSIEAESVKSDTLLDNPTTQKENNGPQQTPHVLSTANLKQIARSSTAGSTQDNLTEDDRGSVAATTVSSLSVPQRPGSKPRPYFAPKHAIRQSTSQPLSQFHSQSQSQVHSRRPSSLTTTKPKPPTRISTTELPGDIFSRRAKQARDELLQREAEEERQRRDFRAKTYRPSLAPSLPVKSTATSSARHRLSLLEASKRASTEAATCARERPAWVGTGGISSSSSSTYSSSSSYHSSNNPYNSYNSSRASSSSYSNGHGHGHGRNAGAGPAKQGQSAAARTRVLSDDASQRKEREELARKARAEAAARNRQASREWAENQQRRKLASS